MQNKIIKEMDIVYNHFEKHATIPLRDASVKNMILTEESFFLKNFSDDENARDNFIYSTFENGTLESIINNVDIIDIDFSSCINYTTPYDDVISFRFHERTASYFFFNNIDVWSSSLIKDESINKDVLVATFIIRFLRFGGRKLLYRILAPKLRDLRFRHDSEIYYFRKLQEIIKQYDISYLPESVKLFHRIEKILTSGNMSDFFISSCDNDIVNNITKPYLDLYCG